MTATKITVEVTIEAPLEKTWTFWTLPEHITAWNNASEDWYTPRAENDLQVGGKFVYRMESKDGNFGFDFEGVYEEIKPKETLVYSIADGRKVTVQFTGNGETTKVEEIFEAENQHAVEVQQSGWQAILNNFKKYTEAN